MATVLVKRLKLKFSIRTVQVAKNHHTSANYKLSTRLRQASFTMCSVADEAHTQITDSGDSQPLGQCLD